MEVYYTHKKRSIRDEYNRPYSFDQAMEGINAGTFTSWNAAMQTLIEFNGDMDAVEQYYRECA